MMTEVARLAKDNVHHVELVDPKTDEVFHVIRWSGRDAEKKALAIVRRINDAVSVPTTAAKELEAVNVVTGLEEALGVKSSEILERLLDWQTRANDAIQVEWVRGLLGDEAKDLSLEELAVLLEERLKPKTVSKKK